MSCPSDSIDRGREDSGRGFESGHASLRMRTMVLKTFGRCSGQGLGHSKAAASPQSRRRTQRAPGHAVEVINLGCAGWASDRVVNLLPALLDYQPDLLVVYAGHNERLAGHLSGGSEPRMCTSPA